MFRVCGKLSLEPSIYLTRNRWKWNLKRETLYQFNFLQFRSFDPLVVVHVPQEDFKKLDVKPIGDTLLVGSLSTSKVLVALPPQNLCVAAEEHIAGDTLCEADFVVLSVLFVCFCFKWLQLSKLSFLFHVSCILVFSYLFVALLLNSSGQDEAECEAVGDSVGLLFLVLRTEDFCFAFGFTNIEPACVKKKGFCKANSSIGKLGNGWKKRYISDEQCQLVVCFGQIWSHRLPVCKNLVGPQIRPMALKSGIEKTSNTNVFESPEVVGAVSAMTSASGEAA